MSDEFVQVSKEEYVLNVIGLGLTVDMLSKMSLFSQVEWAAYVAEEANNQLDKMNRETIEKIVASHSKVNFGDCLSVSEIEVEERNDANNN
ncbi:MULTISPECIES: hypothetical protein [unclassified Nostoc]|uniref:hypothetical protein n=1 Tax=unclassified Nostoc TaxID=2593658 RepID=UPI002AD394B3|nr:hypothetical protein [Nostoc sp. DedQUE03]MDZ7974739.1 hypothetical protein [Nostoc sp. DedQUE03]MDZ8048052.1 hypothetical protein [Nostoc sp. DedQUE02]